MRMNRQYLLDKRLLLSSVPRFPKTGEVKATGEPMTAHAILSDRCLDNSPEFSARPCRLSAFNASLPKGCFSLLCFLLCDTGV